MAAAKGTDNAALVGDVLKAFCCDKDFGVQFTKDTQDYYNNEAAMKELASSDFKSDFLGGQNHIALFVETAPKIDMSKITTRVLTRHSRLSSRNTSTVLLIRIQHSRTSMRLLLLSILSSRSPLTHNKGFVA